MLHQITAKHGREFGLYRDDGLAISRKTPRQIELVKKDLCRMFNEHGMKITIEANKKVVNFLDITLDLTTGTYRPYNKDSNPPAYIHRRSNHPPRIIQNVPKSINKRLSELSANATIFNEATPTYQEALDKSNLNHKLEYIEDSNVTGSRTTAKRRRNVTWYNPPFSKTVATNIGRTFLRIIREEFPTGHPLHKLFNKNTVKISYSCMPNIKQKINNHNRKLLNQHTTQPTTRTCNCRIPANCPMEGKCLTKCIVYQATVETSDSKPPEKYIGLTATAFKTRYNNHLASFRQASKRHSTKLSGHIWKLKDANTDFSIKWRIIKQANDYSTATKRCNLCISEKFYIICRPEEATLNKRNELVSACRHSKKHLLSSIT